MHVSIHAQIILDRHAELRVQAARDASVRRARRLAHSTSLRDWLTRRSGRPVEVEG